MQFLLFDDSTCREDRQPAKVFVLAEIQESIYNWRRFGTPSCPRFPSSGYFFDAAITSPWMNVYSHLVIATFLEQTLAPSNPDEYLLGSAAPDFRYLAGMRRSQTHLSIEQINAYHARYPELASFLLGYAVHCAVDEIDIAPVFFRSFPAAVIRKGLPRQYAPMVIELYTLETTRIENRLAERGNAITSDLGLRDDDVQTASRQINTFLAAPSLEGELTSLRANGLAADPRVARYLAIARQIDRNPLLKKLLFAGLHKKKLTQPWFVTLFTTGALKGWIEAFRLLVQ
jgi:hypothetical protein